MASIENTACMLANAPLWRRILGSFLSAFIGWLALVFVILAWSLLNIFAAPSIPNLIRFNLVSGVVAGTLIFATWLIALVPLYLLVPLQSILWRWPICTICGSASGAAIVLAFGPQVPSIYMMLSALVGGVTCLFASLTKFRFQCVRGSQ
jgi:hypothetical protein